MSYSLRFESRTSRELRKLDAQAAERIRGRLRWLIDNIEDAPREMLAGHLRGLLKLRIGDYRVAYTVDHDARIIVVHMIGHRRDIYDIDMIGDE